MVTHDGYTMMRPLVMDFRDDTAARTIADQYMFGPAFLVSPVTEYQARTRRVYLPAGTEWYDFWTGKQAGGGNTITADAPYDAMPVFVRAGSIVPIGPELQYVGERDGPTTLYVFTGRDGAFSLYEDDGSSYGYERGQFSRVPITWSEGSRLLQIGARAGSFPGMAADRTFDVVFVSPGTPVGYAAAVSEKRIAYRGRAVRVNF